MNISFRIKIISVLALIVFGVASRFLPHMWNFTPLTAIALFASAYLGLRYSVFVLVGIMLISDIFLGFYQWQTMIAVYSSFAVAGIIGVCIDKKKINNIFLGSIGSSLVFFFATNWSVWMFGTMYEHSLSGLMQSYMMAIPFFRNSLAGDLFYTGVLFGAVFVVNAYLARKKIYQYA